MSSSSSEGIYMASASQNFCKLFCNRSSFNTVKVAQQFTTVTQEFVVALSHGESLITSLQNLTNYTQQCSRPTNSVSILSSEK